MKNKMKALSTVLLAIIMIFTMSISTFAADQDTVGDATIEYKGDNPTVTTTVTIPKTIIVTNPQEIKVYGPTIAYDFSVTPVSEEDISGATVKTDADRNSAGDYVTAAVKPGVAGGVTVGTKPSFGTAETAVATGPKGVELTSNLTLNIVIGAFNKAGIYRYKVSDVTTNDALTAAGITRETNYSADRYLDVYIYNDNNGLKIGGYTLLKTNNKDVTGDNDIEAKSPGFISGSTKDSETGKVTKKGSEPTDLYNTINVELDKVVTGGLGDKTFPFSFAIAISNNNGMTYYTTSTEGETVQGDKGTNESLTKELKHGEKFFIKGLNPKATVKYTETNGTEDTYLVTINAKDNSVVNGVEKKSTAKNGTQTTGDTALKVSNYENCTTQGITASINEKITFTNNLDEVSPTNVVMRYAPYLFILGAGVMLLMVSRRRKAEQE